MATVCAIDVGTTRIKALLLNEDGAPGPVSAAPSALSTPAPGVAEVDPEALWMQSLAAIRSAASGGPAPEGLAIANQRATVLLVDDAGRPLAPGLSWQDVRGADELAAWLGQVGEDRFRQATGLVPSTLWSVARVLWWCRRDMLHGARIATVQDWLLRRLGAEEWTLDYSNASLTGLLNLHSLQWDEALLRAAGLSPAQLPSLAPSATQVGGLSREAAAATGLRPGTPLILGGGNQQCASLGAGVAERGAAAVDLGTAGVIDVPVDRVTIDPGRRLVCLAHVAPDRWLLEGLENSYGSARSWGQALLGQDPVSLAEGAPAGSRGLLFVPYLAGSGAPDYDAGARGAVLGLTLAHGRADVARAILEGATVELMRILDAARELVPVERLIASGGGANRPLLLSMLADLARAPVARAAHAETGLVGAGLLAWVGLGRFAGVADALASLPPLGEAVMPDARRAAAYQGVYERYLEALAGLHLGGILRGAQVPARRPSPELAAVEGPCG